MKRFRQWFNYEPEPGESYQGVASLTIPGQAVSLQMQIARAKEYGRFMVRPVHFTDSDIPLPPMDDLTDIANLIDYRQRLAKKLEEYENTVKQAKEQKETEKYAQEMEKRFQEYLKSQQSSPSEPGVKK